MFTSNPSRFSVRKLFQRSLLWAAAALIMASGAAANAQYSYTSPVHLGVLDGMGSVNGSTGINGLVNVNATIYDGQTMWYRFTIPDARNVSVRLDSFGGSLTCMWWPVVGSGIIDTLTAGPWLADVSQSPCGPNDYWLIVQKTPSGTAGSAFRIGAQATPPIADTAPNIQGQGRFLGTATGSPMDVNEYVGHYDWDDYYKVTVGSNLNLNVQIFPQFSQFDIDLRVFGPSGMIVAQSVRAGIANESVNFRVPSAGTYEVRVSSPNRSYTSGDNAFYRMRVFTAAATNPPPTNPDLGGNTPALATPVTMYAGFGNPLTERIGGSDPNDWYTFYMPLYNGASYLNDRGLVITVSGVSVPVTVQLFDARTNSLVMTNTASAGVGGTATINANLQIRTSNGYFIPYYILVTSTSPLNGPYTITVTPSGV